MQNGHGSGRSNGLGRNHHAHHMHGHHGIKNRDLKLNINNAKTIVDNSMLRSDEKERQKQEARAQRERNRGSSSAPPEKNEALFAVVQVSPNPGHDRFQISDILGDFSEVSKHHKSTDLIGVDHQPPTPAPVANAHLHDPDSYSPLPLYGSRGPSDFYSYSHRSHGHGVPPVGPRPSKHQATGPHYKMSHQQKFTEEVKPSLKSGPGPGPGPGPGSKPFQDRGPPNNIPPSGGPLRGRPRSQERAVKDPQVQKIMSEMSDLKSPLSAILQTPRPDHQSSFTFPTPAIPVSNKDSSGFRHPPEPPLKPGNPPENRSSSSVIPSNAIESSISDDFQLSEESDEEVGDSLGGQNKGEICNAAEGGSKASSISPMKNTDESSNSEDSSGTDSESSSSEEEEKQSPAPASPTPSDKNPWSLSNIFQQGNNKEESLVHEVGIKGSSDPVYDIKPEPMPPSPHTVDEPAPPVVTTVPGSNPSLDSQLKGASRPLCSPTTTDESSDDEAQPTTVKAKKALGSRTLYRSSKISPSKVKKIIDPVLSSESEDEVQPKLRSLNKNPSQPLSKSPRVNNPPPPINKRHHQPVARKPPKRKKESSDRLKPNNFNSGSDSDGDDSIATPASERCLSKKTPSSVKSQVHPTKSKLANGEHHHAATAFDRSPKKMNLPPSSSSGSTNDGDRCKIAHKEPKYNGEIKSDGVIDNASAKISLGSVSKVEDPDAQKRSKREKEEDLKVDKKKRKRNRHQNEVEVRERKGHGEGTENDVQRVEEDRVKVSPVTRKPSNSNNNNNVNNNNYYNSIKVSLPNNSVLQYENGVPKLLCSIPFNLIDKLPSKLDNSVKDERVNKEVLEMRTSGGKGKDKGKSAKSPPNEDETKLRAIYSIYKKRQSSLEPDKIKREVKTEITESQDVKSSLPLNPKVEEPIVKQEIKPQIKEETKSFKPSIEAPVKKDESSSSLPAVNSASSLGNHSHSKKHKKDKRKERNVSSCKDKALDPDPTKRRRREFSPEPDNSQKRSRENSRESTRSSKSSSQSQHNPKKQKTSHDDENRIVSPRESTRDTRLSSPHPRTSQRNVSEERPPSALSSEATLAPYQSRPKQPQSVSSQFPQKGPLVISPYLDHESEEDLSIGDGVQRGGHSFPSEEVGIGDGVQRGGHSFPSARDKLTEESHGASGGDTSEYHSLPSSEHGSSTYRTGEEHSSPLGIEVAPQLIDCDQMYPPEINPSPGPSMEFSNSLTHSQEIASNATLMFFSYFERQIPEILKDNTQYLNTAKELKHLADKERHRALQTIIYLEAVLYFILTGESMESDPNTYGPSYTMYNDTFKLIRHVSSPIFKNLKEGPHKLNVILTILSLRCQSLLALKLCSMKRNEMKESLRVVCDFLKVNVFQGIGRQPAILPSSTPSASSTCAGGGTPSGGVWGGSQRSAANNSPSSLSPTPSPAGSVGSEGSQSSSGYSTEGTRQRGQPPPVGATPPQEIPVLSVPSDVHSMMIKHCHLSYTLNSSHEMWLEADDLVYRHNMKDFFIDLDRIMGPLTLHSSLRDLVKYVKTALDKLKKLVVAAKRDVP